MKHRHLGLLGTLAFLLIAGCSKAPDTTTPTDETATVEKRKSDFLLEYETFTLDNGLTVIFHIDRSDPVTAVALTAHVGSAREVEGRTGFAHLFEHLLFLESENLGYGGLDAMSARIGGSGANGSTSRDRTDYYQTVPNDALEKMIWAEADKLGWFINTVTVPVLEKEKQVVKNEKRQGVDNRPYGHVNYVIDKNLYPKGHPYSWQIIGSLEDLQAATLDDVHQFFKRWYVPNNVSLVIAGDFDPAQAKQWVQKYFDEIPRGQDIPKLEKQPAVLEATKHLKYEDNFAQQPQLTMTWPGVPRYSEDAFALEYLTALLADGKQSPMYKVLVEEKGLTSGVTMYPYNSEIAGQINLIVRAFENKDLNDVAAAITESFKKFETEGISEKAMERIRVQQEKAFYENNANAINKAFQLANYDLYTGNPGFINEHINLLLNVTEEDIWRVYNTYIKDKHFVSTSFVPKGQDQLALKGATPAVIAEEKILPGSEANFDLSQNATYEKTPSTFDRSKEPPYGKAPVVSAPPVWSFEASNGLKVSGIENGELPLVALRFTFQGGQLLENLDNVGIAALLAGMLDRGTINKTKGEIEEAVELIGASVSIAADKSHISINANGLAGQYEQLMDIVSEIITSPRFDEEEFNQLKTETIEQIKALKGDPRGLADNYFMQLLYGEDSVYGYDPQGTVETVEAITLEDVQAFYKTAISSKNSYLNVVGKVSQTQVASSIKALESQWQTEQANVLSPPVIGEKRATAKLYFYDVPGAKQSQIRMGNVSLKANDADFLNAQVANYKIGGGGFAARLMQVLRSEKGYTYGIYSGFFGNAFSGQFRLQTGVRSNVTLESLEDILSIVADYSTTFTDEDLAGTQSYFVKSSARSFESLNNKLQLVSDISILGRSPDYIAKRNEAAVAMSIEDIAQLSQQYINLEEMVILVVGDAATQLERLKELGLGEPVRLN